MKKAYDPFSGPSPSQAYGCGIEGGTLTLDGGGTLIVYDSTFYNVAVVASGNGIASLQGPVNDVQTPADNTPAGSLIVNSGVTLVPWNDITVGTATIQAGGTLAWARFRTGDLETQTLTIGGASGGYGPGVLDMTYGTLNLTGTSPSTNGGIIKAAGYVTLLGSLNNYISTGGTVVSGSVEVEDGATLAVGTVYHSGNPDVAGYVTNGTVAVDLGGTLLVVNGSLTETAGTDTPLINWGAIEVWASGTADWWGLVTNSGTVDVSGTMDICGYLDNANGVITEWSGALYIYRIDSPMDWGDIIVNGGSFTYG
jgi:cytoskeletal protein CcmA (bactofilin family)